MIPISDFQVPYLVQAIPFNPAFKPSLEQALFLVQPENAIEREIVANAEWREGASLGKPRPGHPEGEVIYHILEVLANVEKWCAENQTSPEDRSKLRIIAMIHDTFKHKVDRSRPEEGENHHAAIAARFAETLFITDPEILAIIEHHDDAYLIWRAGSQNQDWNQAEANIRQLVQKLQDHGARSGLYQAFYCCDSATGDKDPSHYAWFTRLLQEM